MQPLFWKLELSSNPDTVLVSGALDFDLLLHTIQAQIEPVTEGQVRVGRLAYKKYGKGRHPASLNYGDCF